MNHVKLSIEIYNELFENNQKFNLIKKSKAVYIKQGSSLLWSGEEVYTDDEAIAALAEKINTQTDEIKQLRIQLGEVNAKEPVFLKKQSKFNDILKNTINFSDAQNSKATGTEAA